MRSPVCLHSRYKGKGIRLSSGSKNVPTVQTKFVTQHIKVLKIYTDTRYRIFKFIIERFESMILKTIK